MTDKLVLAMPRTLNNNAASMRYAECQTDTVFSVII